MDKVYLITVGVEKTKAIQMLGVMGSRQAAIDCIEAEVVEDEDDEYEGFIYNVWEFSVDDKFLREGVIIKTTMSGRNLNESLSLS